MSSTYVGYLLKMPKKLDTAQARTAVKARLERLKVLRKNLKDLEYDWAEDAEDLNLDHCTSISDAFDWCEFWDSLNHKKLLEFIFDEPQDGCDCQIRSDPDSPNARWIACGSMTCGEDPDGETYQWISTLDKLGLFDVLGIR